MAYCTKKNSIESVSKGCKEYKKVYNELLKYLKKCNDNEMNNLINVFSQKYLALYLWKPLLKGYPSNYQFGHHQFVNGNFGTTPNIVEKATFHFEFKGTYSEMRPYKFLNQQDTQKFWDADLSVIFFGDLEYFIFSHSMLPSFWKVYKKLSKSPIKLEVIQKYDKALKLYKKMIDAEKRRNFSLEKWIKSLEEWDDEEFVIHNIEKKLSENVFDKEFWKAYIKYLKKKKNTKAMLGVYSRFCGLFLNDKKMEKEYIAEAEKHGINVGDQLLDYQEFGSIVPFNFNVKNDDCNTKINLHTALPQNLLLPASILTYVMKDTVILQKLHKTCKYFCLIRPTPICYRFVIASKSSHFYSLMPNNTHTRALKFDEQSLIITAENPSIKNLKNLYITNYVYIQSVFNVLRLSNILKCIWKCEIKYLTIENQTMLFKDYQLLTKAKTVKEIKFVNAQIWTEDGFLTQLEEIMETLPNAVYIDFKNFPQTMGHPYGRNMIAQEINDQTFKKLSNLKRNKKIQYFSLTILNQLFDPFSFIQFVEDNLDDIGSNFYLHFGTIDLNNNGERIFQENSFLSIANYVSENRQPEKKIFGSVIIHGITREVSFAL